MTTTTASERAREYDRLHQQGDLRFPLEDYPIFCSWLNAPRGGAGLRLLDIACGQGFFLDAAARVVPGLELHAIDFSQVAAERATARVPAADVRQASATALPYDDAFFDYCVNLGSLEHFERPEEALREMRRVMKPSAKAMVIVPNQYYLGSVWKALAYGESEDQGQEGLTVFRTVKEWSRLFTASDLDVTGVRPYNGEHHIAWYFRRPAGEITESERRWRATLDTFVKPLIPLNLSQCFVFSLRRQPE